MTPNLQEARREFERAEGEADPGAKLAALEEALALVEELLDEPGAAEHDKTVARNVRRTYLRKLIQQLVQMRDVRILDWCGYIRLLTIDHRAEVQAILLGDPSLKAAYGAFAALWSREFRDAFGRDIDDL